jgi:hypothetical protein
MLTRVPHILILLLTLAASLGVAKEQPQKALPAVLIIGDEVYQPSAKAIAGELKGQANVIVPKMPAHLLANSANAIEQIDLLLGLKDAAGNDVPEAKRPVWNVVHLNVGLGDLIHRVPGLKSNRSLPYDFGGVVTTPPEQYEKNLDTLIQIIKKKAPTAKIVWANTTPIPVSPDNWFKPGSEIEYNQIAGRVMKKHGVPINDMHAYALGIMKEAKPASTDPFNFGKTPIHPPVVECILRELSGK